MSSIQLQAVTLTAMGTLLALFGVFAAGSIEIIALGIGGIAFAGVLAAFGARRAA